MSINKVPDNRFEIYSKTGRQQTICFVYAYDKWDAWDKAAVRFMTTTTQLQQDCDICESPEPEDTAIIIR